MRSSAGTRGSATRRPVIVVAGEDANDRHCLRTIIEELCPESRGRIVYINQTVRLSQAGDQNLRERALKLVRLARARAAKEQSELAALVVHEDYDAIYDDQVRSTHGRVLSSLRKHQIDSIYALAVEEIEAWLLLYPGALEAHVTGWRFPKTLRGRNTALLSDPKSIIRNQIARTGRPYHESDSSQILDKARELKLLHAPTGSNASLEQFMKDISILCAGLNRRSWSK